MKTKEEKGVKIMYDASAEFYHSERLNKKSECQFYNVLTEMPAMLKMMGNVKNKKVLDWGCGSGIYIKILSKNGAKIKGFDISKEMIKIAKKDNPDIDLRVGSGLNIPFSEKFDIVFASLALHYLNNWDKSLKEISKVLRKNGYFIFSIINPIKRMTSGHEIKGKEYRVLGIKDYFKEGLTKYDWFLPDGQKVVIPQYHKTYSTILKTIVRNSFEIVDYEDLKPVSQAKKMFPEKYEIFSKIPNFCILKLKKK